MKRIYLSIFLILGIFHAGTASLLASEARDRALRFPVKAYENGKYSIAIDGFKDFLNEYPNDTQTLQVKKWLAFSYQKKNKKKKAFSVLLKAFRSNPSSDVFEHLAKLGKDLDRVETLLPLLDKETLKNYPSLQKYFISWKVSRDKVSQARKTLNSIPEASMSNETERFMNKSELKQSLIQIRDKVRNGVWKSHFEDDLERLETLNPSIKVWVQKAVNKFGKKNNYKQLVEFTNKVPQKWTTPAVQLYRAEALIEISKKSQKTKKEGDTTSLEQARNLYKNLIDENAHKNEARYGLAWILNREEQYERSQEHLNRLRPVSLNEKLATQVILLKARNQRKLGNHSQASRSYKKVINNLQGTNEVHQARLGLTRSLLAQGKNTEAGNIIDSININKINNRSEYYELQADYASRARDKKLEKKALKNAIQSTNNSDRIHRLKYRLGKLTYSQGNVSKAFEILNSIYYDNPRLDLVSALSLAIVRVSVDLERYDKALSVIEYQSDRLQRDYPEQYLYLNGISNFQKGNYKKSEELFSKLIQRYPDSNYAIASRTYKFRSLLEFAEPAGRETTNELEQTIKPLSNRYKKSLKWTWANKLFNEENYQQSRDLYQKLLNSDISSNKKAQSVGRLIDIAIAQDNTNRVKDIYKRHKTHLFGHPSGMNGVLRVINTAYANEQDEFTAKVAKQYLNEFQDPSNVRQITFILAEITRVQGNEEKALEHYRSVIQLSESDDKKRQQAEYRVGLLSYEKETYKEAIQQLEKFRENPPNFVNSGITLLALSKSYQKIDRPYKAKETLEELKSSDDSPLSKLEVEAREMFLSGLIQSKEGNIKKAEETLYKVLFRYSDWNNLDQVLYHLQNVLSKQGKTEEANKITKRLQNNFPDSPYIERIEK